MADTELAPVYRYFTADLLTGEILSEIPFRSVSYERAIKGAGSFSGSIPVIDATDNLELYETTMPGNTALYAVRNGVCVWGGIIWSRSYDVVGRVLQVSASEFTSYFYHRRMWKSWNHQYEGTVTVANGEAEVVLSYGSASTALIPGASVKLEFSTVGQTRYDGFYEILGDPTPTFTIFAIDNAQQIATINSISRIGNTVSAATDTKHGLSVNDKVVVDFGTGAGSEFNGTHVVTSVGGSEDNIFTFILSGADYPLSDVSGSVTRPLPDGVYKLVTVSVRTDTFDYIRSLIDSVFADFVGIDFPNTYIEPGISYSHEIIQKEVDLGVATLKTADAHDLAPGQAVQVQNVDPNFDGEFYVTEVRAADEFSYELGGFLAPTAVAVLIEDIERISVTDGIVTVTTLDSHEFLVDQTVDISTGITEGGAGPVLNGTYTISEVLSATKFKYASGYAITIPEIVFDPATASSESRRNLIANPNLETNATGWSVSGPITAARDTSQFHSGTASYRVEFNTTDGVGARYLVSSIAANSDYTFSVYIKGTAGNYVKTFVHELTSGSANISTTYETPIQLTGSWQRIDQTITTSATTGQAYFGVGNAGSIAHTVYIDDALLEKSANLGDYFDGSSTDTYDYTYSWASTANASQSIAVHNLDIILAEINGNVATITATEPPDFTVGNSMTVSGVYPQYSIIEKSLDAANSKATLTTDGPHYLQVGDTIDVVGLRDYSRINARSISGTVVEMHTSLSHNLFVGDTVEIIDMKDNYYLTNKSLSSNVVTLTTSINHNMSVGNDVTISGVYDRYSVVGKVLSNGVATITLDTPTGGHNFQVNSNVTISGMSDTYTVVSKVVEAGIVTLTTNAPHNMGQGKEIIVSGLGAPYDGDKFRILSVTDTRITYELPENSGIGDIALSTANGSVTAKDSVFNGSYVVSGVTASTVSFNRGLSDIAYAAVSGGAAVGYSFMNGTFTITAKSANTFSYALTGYNVSSVAIELPADAKEARAAAKVDSVHLGTRTVTAVTRNTFRFTQAGLSNNVVLENVDGIVTVNSIFNGTGITITAINANENQLTYTKSAPNNVLETPTNSLAYVSAPNIYNGTFTITAVDLDLNTINYAKTHINMGSTSIQGYGSATVNPVAIVSSFGPFPGNADIGIEYSTTSYSGKNVAPVPYRGFELTNVGDALSKYSDSIDGFEYRIDCSYDVEADTFRKTFILIPIDFPNPPVEGEVSPLSRFGADKLVFEYPGNIINVTINESAENSATRFFAIGENDLGPDAGPPFSVKSATGLLRGLESKRKWPLLDDDEQVKAVEDEDTLYAYAERYLDEARPPDAQLSVSVNGSLQPIIGSYAPGDWCSLIVDDKFILQRLASDLEPRDTVIVRKIDSIKVSVPDGTTFPEKVDLTLVPEWRVDTHAQ